MADLLINDKGKQNISVDSVNIVNNSRKPMFASKKVKC
jgi:hypothetical protein